MSPYDRFAYLPLTYREGKLVRLAWLRLVYGLCGGRGRLMEIERIRYELWKEGYDKRKRR